MIERRPIPGFEGRYAVSADGKIYTVKHKVPCGLGRFKTVYPALRRALRDHKGYLRVCLTSCGKNVTVKVHCAVAGAFLGQRPAGFHVAHLDGNKNNNRVENLAYVTPKENAEHAIVHGTMQYGERNGHAKLTRTKARQIIGLRKNGSTYKSIADKFGVSVGAVVGVANGTNWSRALREAA